MKKYLLPCLFILLTGCQKKNVDPVMDEGPAYTIAGIYPLTQATYARSPTPIRLYDTLIIKALTGNSVVIDYKSTLKRRESESLQLIKTDDDTYFLRSKEPRGEFLEYVKGTVHMSYDDAMYDFYFNKPQ